MITRRFVLKGALGLLVPAPMVVRAASLMPILPEAFVERSTGLEMPLSMGDSLRLTCAFEDGAWSEVGQLEIADYRRRLTSREEALLLSKTFVVTKSCAVVGARLGSRGSMELVLRESPW